MSFGGKLARGLLQGASGYFGKVAENQEFDRRAAALEAREAAMERLRTANAMARDTHQGTITRENTKAEWGIRGDLAEADDKRTAEMTEKELRIKFQNEYALLSVAEQGKMTREQYVQGKLDARHAQTIAAQREAQEDSQEHDRTTKPIATMLNERGEVVQGFGSGNTRTYNNSRPTKAASDDDDGPIRLPSRGTAAAPAPAPAAPQNFAQFDQMMAEAAMHPNFKGKSAAEVRAEIIALAKRNGIPAPAR